MAVDGVRDVGEAIGIGVTREGLKGMKTSYGRSGVLGRLKDIEGQDTGAVNDMMRGLPRDAVTDGFDCGVAGGDEDEVSEFCNFGSVVDYRDVGGSLRQPFAMFWSAR